MRLMGIDFGSKKVGIAFSDEAQGMAFPLEVVPNTEDLLERVVSLAKTKEISGIVMGESRNYSGLPNTIAKEAEKFAKKLQEHLSVPVYFEPEMLTTKEAERLQGSTSMTDASAAALILQSYLDRQKGKGASVSEDKNLSDS